jgi:hypothetical protein
LKLPKNQADSISIQKEILCHALLEQWNITSPAFSWLQLPKQLVQKDVKRGGILPFHFGSSFLENSFDLSDFFAFDKKVNHR